MAGVSDGCAQAAAGAADDGVVRLTLLLILAAVLAAALLVVYGLELGDVLADGGLEALELSAS